VHALKGVSLTVGEGEVVVVIGANGAGKSTLLRAITGVVPPRGGSIMFRGEAIHGLAPHQVVRKGISCSPEGRQVFPYMTVMENLQMGAYGCRDRSAFRSRLEEVFDLFPVLQERVGQLAGTLSGGEQQMLAVARALMANPKLLLMDEPSMGLAPKVARSIFTVITRIRDRGTSVLLVEQNARLALSIADRGYALEVGEVRIEGSSRELLGNDMIRKAYLGEE
jgi:branched-chain amino acid transport system ATP-binding protein